MAPSSVLALLLLAQLTATWADNSGGAASTRLERRGPDEPYSALVDVAPGVMTYVDEGTVAGVLYCYRALAFDESGTSPYSNEACAEAPLPPPPADVSLVLSAIGPGKVSAAVDGAVAVSGCSSTCATSVPRGSIAVLTAVPNNRQQVFVGWDGDAAGCPATCVVLLDASKSAAAQFRRR